MAASVQKALESLGKEIREAIAPLKVLSTFGMTAVPGVNTAVVNAIRAFWLRTRARDSASGVAKFDAEGIIQDTLRTQAIIEGVFGIDAEFVTEVLEEAFSESAMTGIGGAFYIEGAIRAGMLPYQQPHNPVAPELDGLADNATGTFWVNAVHYHIEQLVDDVMRKLAPYEPLIRAPEAFAAPLAPLARVDILAAAAQQVVQNILDALNALYARVVESLSAYLAAKHLVEQGAAGAEAEQEMRVRLVAALESVLENIAIIEDNVAALDEEAGAFVDIDVADEVATYVERAVDPLLESVARGAGAWFHRMMASRWVVPDAGFRIAWSDGSKRRELRAYPSGYAVVDVAR